jgi:hypothetical protein
MELRSSEGDSLRKIYISGMYLTEKHIEDAWARARAGVRLELAAASVLPASKRINSINRAAYESNLITILSLKSNLFTKAYAETVKGGDWHRIFRGRKRIFWPNAEERKALGLSDYSDHELVLNEPTRGRPIKLKMMIDHGKRSVMKAVVMDLDGHVR